MRLSLLLVMSGELTGVGETVPRLGPRYFGLSCFPSIHDFHMFAQSP